MQKRNLSFFLAGVLTTAINFSGITTALAASDSILFNRVNISMDGELVFSTDDYLELDNGEKVPSSILYVDGIGGGTTYLPLAYFARLVELPVSWDDTTGTVILGYEVLQPDEFIQQLAQEWLVDGDYPKNSKGETYGPDVLSELLGYPPDLTAATATNGKDGYLRQSELDAYRNMSLEELKEIELSGKPYTLPVYDCEGNAIGEFVFPN